MSDQPARKPPRSRRWRMVKIAAVCALSLCLGAIGAAIYLARSEPAHWKQHQAYLKATSPEQITRIARSVEQRLLALTPKDKALARDKTGKTLAGLADNSAGANGPTAHKLHLSSEEINAWIADKLDDWMQYRDYVMPTQIRNPMIEFDKGRTLLSFEFDAGEFQQVFTAAFDIRFEKNGMAVLDIRRVMAGDLDLPSDDIGAYLRKFGPDTESCHKVADWLDKLDHLEFKPTMKINGDYEARVRDYKVVNKGVDLTLSLIPRPGYGPAPRQTIASVPVDGE